jgi:hypothetical protein
MPPLLPRARRAPADAPPQRAARAPALLRRRAIAPSLAPALLRRRACEKKLASSRFNI